MEITRKIKNKGKNRRKKKVPLFDFTKDQLEDLKNAFEIFDHEGTGLLPIKYLKIILRAFGFDSDRESINQLTLPMGKDYDDKLNYEEFEIIIQRLMTEEVPVDFKIRAFQLYYHNNSGNISFNELKEMSNDLGENITEESIRDMILGATEGMKEEVNVDDFKRILRPPEPF